MTFVDYFSGSQGGCPNGGAIYAAGNPPVNAYVCNGTNGTHGTNGTGGTRADGPCWDNMNRYVDCGNGTVTDTVTGLIWLKNANCFSHQTYSAANQAAAGLAAAQCGLTDGSSAGDWRLPTTEEWQATIARAVTLGCKSGSLGGPPSLTNDAGTDCFSAGPTSFTGVQWGPNLRYRSSSTLAFSTSPFNVFPTAAFAAYLDLGVVGSDGQKAAAMLNFGWPVRGGPH